MNNDREAKMRTVLTQATNIDNHPQTNSATQAT